MPCRGLPKSLLTKQEFGVFFGPHQGRRLKMRISLMFFSLLLLLLLVSVEFGPVMVNAARIPEHTCRKVIETRNGCEFHKCFQECSKEPAGLGCCRDKICYCTYYCKDPPIYLLLAAPLFERRTLHTHTPVGATLVMLFVALYQM